MSAPLCVCVCVLGLCVCFQLNAVKLRDSACRNLITRILAGREDGRRRRIGAFCIEAFECVKACADGVCSCVQAGVSVDVSVRE